MSGSWIQQRGPNVQIPIVGGIDASCGTLVSATAASPASITLGSSIFCGQDSFAFPIPQTSVVQITTMFTFFGPNSQSLGPLAPGPKGTRPANFGWCPGAAANPGCTTPQTGGGQGTGHGIVSYSAGPNQFGGTMRMLIAGSGEVSRIIGAAPLRIQHNTIAAGAGIPQAIGGAYSNSNNNVLAAGVITTGGVCAGGNCGTAGLIAVPGVPDGSASASSSTSVGFPWTTGMVSAIVTTMAPATSSTLTGSGSDNRSNLGSGMITLVAGGISFRTTAGTSFASLDTISMSMRARNLPSVSINGLLALAGLMVLGAGYAARRRLTQ